MLTVWIDDKSGMLPSSLSVQPNTGYIERACQLTATIRHRPALIVKGRMYDVQTRHLLEPVDDYVEAAAKQVVGIHLNPSAEGDVLVFMPGADEIETCAEILRRAAKELGHEDQGSTSRKPLKSTMTVSLHILIAIPPYSSHSIANQGLAQDYAFVRLITAKSTSSDLR